MDDERWTMATADPFDFAPWAQAQDKFHRFTLILYLSASADLAEAFSIAVSGNPAASVRWAIRDGWHNNMQAGKKGFFISHKYP